MFQSDAVFHPLFSLIDICIGAKIFFDDGTLNFARPIISVKRTLKLARPIISVEFEFKYESN